MQELVHNYAAFDPRAYLQDYYDPLPPESIDLLQFLIDVYRDLPANGVTLDLGGGPTLYTAIVAAGQGHEIHISDYLEANRTEVDAWLRDDPDAFDWSDTIRTTLELEGQTADQNAVRQRAATIRERVTHVLHCDVLADEPIPGARERYDVVVTNFCLEAAARSLGQWQQCVRNTASLVKPGGQIIIAAVKEATTYAVGDVVFPVVYLTEDDILQALLDTGFVPASITMEWIPADHPVHPYGGCVFVAAAKEAQRAVAAGA